MSSARNSALHTISEVDNLNQRRATRRNLQDATRLQKRVCTRFVPQFSSIVINADTYCCCGRQKLYHNDAALLPRSQLPIRSPWQVEEDTGLERTDACGTYYPKVIGGKHATRYVRVDYAADMTQLRDFLHREWKLEPANFVVTLIGSTSPVYLRKKMRSAVQRSLLRLVETCDQLGGWLLTSGAGIFQQISSALNEQPQLERNLLHLIAIQPWGTLRYEVRKELVDNTARDEGPSPSADEDVIDGFPDKDDMDSIGIQTARRFGRRGTAPNVLDFDSETVLDSAQHSTVQSPTGSAVQLTLASPTTSRRAAATSVEASSNAPTRGTVGSQLVARTSSVSKKPDKFSGSINKRMWVDTSEANRLHELPQNYPFTLLVDTGQLGSPACGSENSFRQRLEVELTKRCSHDSAGYSQHEAIAPACYVLFGGGPRSTRQVQYALSRQIPVVVLQGTGKISDILALACTKADEEDLDPAFVRQNGLPDRLRVYFRQAIKERVEVKDEQTLNDILIDVEKCMAYHNLIFVYAINADDGDLDVRVLRAMFSNIMRPRVTVGDSMGLRQPSYSVNSEPEVAQDCMLPIDVDEMLCNALLHNHIDCARLLLSRTALRLHEFLTIDRLGTLYVPENLKASTFKSMLSDRRLRDARWYNARQSTANKLSKSDPDIHQHVHLGFAAESDVGAANRDQIAMKPLAKLNEKRRVSEETKPTQQGGFDFTYCPLTLAGKVITRLLGTYFHSSFLHFGHHLEHHPDAVLAAGHFSAALKVKAKNSNNNDNNNAQVEQGGEEEAILEPLDSDFLDFPDSTKRLLERLNADEKVVVSATRSRNTPQVQFTPVRHRRHTSITRHAIRYPNRTSLLCSGDHTEVIRIKIQRLNNGNFNETGSSDGNDVFDGAVFSRANAARSVQFESRSAEDQQSLLAGDAVVERRVIASRFRFIRTEECAALHLFIWCVLQMRIELAMLFWRRTNHKMAAAFLARLVLRGLLKAEKSVEMKERIRLECDKFESLALGVLNLAYDTDARLTESLLLAQLDDVGQMSTIQLAARADCKNFIAHPACTSILEDVWCDGLSPRNPWWRIVLCIVVPVLIPFLIVFHLKSHHHTVSHSHAKQAHLRVRDESIDSIDNVPSSPAARVRKASVALLDIEPSREHEESAELDANDAHLTFYKRMKAAGKAERLANQTSHSEQTMTDAPARKQKSHRSGCMCCNSCCQICAKVFNCIIAFYTAPKTIFAMNTMFYVLFLLVFSYMMLFAFNSRAFNIIEWLVAICIVSMTAEEIRQLLMDESGGFKSRIHMYFASVWNRLDFACLLCFYIGFGAAILPYSWCPLCMEFGRILVSISLLILYLRLLNIFSVNQELGPKLVMFGQMIKSVMGVFIMIAIFVLAYGVAAQSILYPNIGQHNVLSVIRNASLRGYFAMFGDLRLEEIFEATPCDSLHTYAVISSVSDDNTSLEAESTENPQYCTNDLAQYTVPVLLAVHVVMTNLVLFNVLIAIFNFIFNKIDDQTDEHWRYNMYCLIEEYRAKPPLIPPLVLIWHVSLIIYWLIEVLPCCNAIRNADCFAAVRKRFTVPPFCCEHVSDDARRRLFQFEHRTAHRYMKEIENAKRAETVSRLCQIDNSVRETNTLLAAVHDVVIATDYNTELLKKRERQQFGLDIIKSTQLRGELQKMVHDTLDARVRPLEDKLNAVLQLVETCATALAELKSTATTQQ